ncbi:MAG TPA: HAD-IA family hydrolase [Pseudonocardiaceae bacterium]|nr:HAD-IA family hydrolase [Pseudonocardiaceae bacterium]
MDPIPADAILFDLDGTLVDSFGVSTRWWQDWAPGVGLTWDAIAAQVRGRHAITAIRELLPDRPPELNEADAVNLGDWEEGNVHLMRATSGAAQLIDLLKPDRWAVVTTSSRDQAHARLRAAGLPIPSVLITSDDVRDLKPDPEGYLLACTALGVRPANCVVVEDSVTGVLAGRAAGATVLAIGAAAIDGTIRIEGLSDLQLAEGRMIRLRAEEARNVRDAEIDAQVDRGRGPSRPVRGRG